MSLLDSFWTSSLESFNKLDCIFLLAHTGALDKDGVEDGKMDVVISLASYNVSLFHKNIAFCYVFYIRYINY